MSYFVSPPDETSFAFDRDEFLGRLLDWEGMSIRPTVPDDGLTVIEWQLKMNRGVLYGSLDGTCQVVHLDGDIADCALFALWLRMIVPQFVELLFYDEAYSADIALVAFTDEDDLVQMFGT